MPTIYWSDAGRATPAQRLTDRFGLGGNAWQHTSELLAWASHGSSPFGLLGL